MPYLDPDFPEESQGFFFSKLPAEASRQSANAYLCTCMSKLRKIALGGIAVVVVATIAFKIAGIYPGIVAVHALPFCIMLMIDISRKRDRDAKK